MNFRIVNEQVRANAIAAIRAIEIDREKLMTVRIEEDKKSRTLRQNAYLWGVVYKTLVDNDPGYFFNEERGAIILEHKIKPADVVHEFCKERFLDFVMVGEVKVFPSTKKLSREQFVDYVESITRWAAMELQIYIPPPAHSGFDDVWPRAIVNEPIEGVVISAYNDSDVGRGGDRFSNTPKTGDLK